MQENKMGVMRVDKLIITMSLPMMVSMLVQALYNIVDSIFVSRISENALTAVSLAFPIQSLLMAFLNGVGVGMNSLLSRSLGEKNGKSANEAARHGIFMAAICYVIFLAFGLLLVKPYYSSQLRGASEEITGYGVTYLTIVCVCSFGIFSQVIMERLLQATGRTLFTMITQLTGAVFNLIFDPILIFGLFGFPKLGVAGAAIATVGGQMLAASMALIFNLRLNREIKLTFRGFRPQGAVIKRILTVGVPTTLMQAIGSIATYIMNSILIVFSSTATAVYGIYFKLQSFALMPIFGMNNGLVPIIAYNLGAKKKARIKEAIKYGLLFAEIIMLVALAVFELFPAQLLGLFDASEHMLSIGVPALRTIAIGFPLIGLGIVSSTTFQALGNGVYSMITSMTRQLIVLIPVAYLFSKISLSAVWWAHPIAECVSIVLSLTFLIRIVKRVVNGLPD